MKYIIGCLLSLGIIVVNDCSEQQLKINNATREGLYIALVKTKNFNHSKLFDGIKGMPGQVTRLGSANTFVPLQGGHFVEIPHLDKAPTRYGITQYDRSLWVSNDINALKDALNKGIIIDKSKIFFGEIGSNTTATITKTGSKYKIDTSKKAANLADVEGQDDAKVYIERFTKKGKV